MANWRDQYDSGKWRRRSATSALGRRTVLVGGIAIGSAGAVGSIYQGFKLDFGDDFNSVPNMWDGANLSGKYSSSRPQSLNRRINGTWPDRMMYVDPHWRGARHQSPTDLGYSAMSASNSVLSLTASTVPSESLSYLPTSYTQGGGDAQNRPLLFSGAIRGWPSYMWSAEGDWIYEGKVRMPSGVARGYWPSLWDAGLDWPYFGELDLVEAEKDALGAITNKVAIHTGTTSGGADDGALLTSYAVPADTMVWYAAKKVGGTIYLYDDVATPGTLALRATYTNDRVGRLKGAHDIRLELAVNNQWDSSTYNAADWPKSVEYDWFRIWTPTGTPTPTAMNVLSQINTTPGGSWSFTIPSDAVLFGADFTPNVVDATGAFDNEDAPGYPTAANRVPGGMTVDLTARTITGTVPSTEGGRVGVLFTASNAAGGAARRAMQYFNVAPAVQSANLFTNQEVLYAGSVNLTIGSAAFHSGNLGPHTYTVTKTGGSWLTITGNGTASISITGTAPSTNETVTLSISCTNLIGQTTTITRTLTVAASFAYNPVTDNAVIEYWNADDASTMFADAAATTAATVNGTVRAWKGKKAGYLLSNSNTLSETIIPAWQTDANTKKVLKFTRANVTRLSNEDSALLTAVDGTNDPFTVTFRFRRGDAGTSSSILTWSSTATSTATRYIRCFVGGTNLPGNSRIGATTQADCTADAGNEITDNNWHTYTYIFNGTTGVLRVDGVQKKSVSQSGAGAITIGRMTLGALYSSATNAYDSANAFNGVMGGIIMSEYTSLTDTNIAAREAYLETLFPA